MTPRSHPDYLPTMSVLHSTKMVIRVMSEVKFREDEYDVVKELASRIHGLPMQVIKRERKLLCQGTLRRIPMPDNPQGFDLVAPLEIIPPRNSKLISAINDWGMRRHASGSSKSTNSTAMSFISLETASCASASLTFDQSSILHPKLRAAGHSPNFGGSRTDDILHVFIFTDIMVLTRPSARRLSSGSPSWVILEDIGLSRLLSITADVEQPGTIR